MMIVKSVLCVVALQNLQVSAFSTGDPTCCGVSIRGKESRHRIQAVLDGTGNGQKAARPSPPKDFAWKSIAISAVVIFAPLSISANAVSVQPSAVQSANALGGLEDSAQRAARQNVQLCLVSHSKEAKCEDMAQVMLVAADTTGLPADEVEQSLATKAGLAFFLTYVGVSLLAGLKELVTRIRKFSDTMNS
jgi:hypothetical protein